MSHECPICLEDRERAIWCDMPCGHKLCFPCLTRLWEHSRHACPLCRHDIHDCLPAPRATIRRAADLMIDGVTEDAVNRIVRRLHATRVVDDALSAHPPIAPRNALHLRRASLLRVELPPDAEVASRASPSLTDPREDVRLDEVLR